MFKSDKIRWKLLGRVRQTAYLPPQPDLVESLWLLIVVFACYGIVSSPSLWSSLLNPPRKYQQFYFRYFNNRNSLIKDLNLALIG